MHLYVQICETVTKCAGHQQLVNDVKFSPDARLVASTSFDKSIRVRDTLGVRLLV